MIFFILFTVKKSTMTQLIKKRSDGNGSLFSAHRSTFFPRFFNPLLFDFDNEQKNAPKVYLETMRRPLEKLIRLL